MVVLYLYTYEYLPSTSLFLPSIYVGGSDADFGLYEARRWLQFMRMIVPHRVTYVRVSGGRSMDKSLHISSVVV